MMRRLLLSAALVAISLAVAAGSSSAANSPICVGTGPGCFATLQAALDAARDGDTIHIGAGTFAGGATIAKNVAITGAGADVVPRARQCLRAGDGPAVRPPPVPSS